VVEAHVLRGVSLGKAWREHLGLTQEAVAVEVVMEQPNLARLEAGGMKPRRSTLTALANVMGLTLAQESE